MHRPYHLIAACLVVSLTSAVGAQTPDAEEAAAVAANERVRREHTEAMAAKAAAAGLKSWEASQYRKALGHLGKALATLQTIPGDAPRVKAKMKMLQAGRHILHVEHAYALAGAAAAGKDALVWDAAVEQLRLAMETDKTQRVQLSKGIRRCRQFLEAAEHGHPRPAAAPNTGPGDDARTLMKKGKVLLDQEQYDQARNLLVQSLTREPANERALRWLRRTNEAWRAEAAKALDAL